MAESGPLFSSRILSFFPILLGLLAVAVVSVCGDLVVSTLPLRPGDAQWRLLAVGGFLGLVPQVAIMLVLINVTAILGGVRGAIRGAAVVAIVGAAVVLLAIALFGLDFLQVRRLVAESGKRRIDLATLKTALFSGVFALLLIWTGLRGWELGKKEDSGERPAREGLFVGQR